MATSKCTKDFTLVIVDTFSAMVWVTSVVPTGSPPLGSGTIDAAGGRCSLIGQSRELNNVSDSNDVSFHATGHMIYAGTGTAKSITFSFEAANSGQIISPSCALFLDAVSVADFPGTSGTYNFVLPAIGNVLVQVQISAACHSTWDLNPPPHGIPASINWLMRLITNP